MASNNRATRSRHSLSANKQPRGQNGPLAESAKTTAHAARGAGGGGAGGDRDKLGARAEAQRAFMQRWLEPPLETPKPSFEEAGLIRFGVCEGMQPLGALPKVGAGGGGAAQSRRIVNTTNMPARTATPESKDDLATAAESGDVPTAAPAAMNSSSPPAATAAPLSRPGARRIILKHSTRPAVASAEAAVSTGASSPDPSTEPGQTRKLAAPAAPAEFPSQNASTLPSPAPPSPLPSHFSNRPPLMEQDQRQPAHPASGSLHPRKTPLAISSLASSSAAPSPKVRRISARISVKRRQSPAVSPAPPPSIYLKEEEGEENGAGEADEVEESAGEDGDEVDDDQDENEDEEEEEYDGMSPSKRSSCSDRSGGHLNKAALQQVIDHAVNQAVMSDRYPTAYAIKTAFQERVDDTGFISIVSAVISQTATEEQTEELARIIEEKKREGRRGRKAHKQLALQPAATVATSNNPSAAGTTDTTGAAATSTSPQQKSGKITEPAKSAMPAQPAAPSTPEAQMSRRGSVSSASSLSPAMSLSSIDSLASGAEGGQEGDIFADGGPSRQQDQHQDQHQNQHQHQDQQQKGKRGATSPCPGQPIAAAKAKTGEAAATTSSSTSTSLRAADNPISSSASFASSAAASLAASSSSPPLDPIKKPAAAANPASAAATPTAAMSGAIDPSGSGFAPVPAPAPAPSVKPPSAAKGRKNAAAAAAAAGGVATRRGDEDPRRAEMERKRSEVRERTSMLTPQNISSVRPLVADPTDETETGLIPVMAPAATNQNTAAAAAATAASAASAASAGAGRRGRAPRAATLTASYNLAIASAVSMGHSTGRSTRAAGKRSLDEAESPVSGSVASVNGDFGQDSRAVTPTTRPTKKQRTGLRVKSSPVKKGGCAAGIPRPIGRLQMAPTGQAENDEFCSACGNNGEVVCCDSCPRSYHFECVDMLKDDQLPDEWFCPECVARNFPDRFDPNTGAMAALLDVLDRSTPQAFRLHPEIQNLFEGVRASSEGDYEEVVAQTKHTTRKRGGAASSDEPPPALYPLVSEAGKAILCHACNKSSESTDPNNHTGRPILSCSSCSTHWHLDCLDPPLAAPPIIRTWLCPLHADEDIRVGSVLFPAHRNRKIKGHPPLVQAFTRGMRNNGLIEVIEDLESDDESGRGPHIGNRTRHRQPRQATREAETAETLRSGIDDHTAGYPDCDSFGRVFKLSGTQIALDTLEKLHNINGKSRKIAAARERARLEAKARATQASRLAEMEAVVALTDLGKTTPMHEAGKTALPPVGPIIRSQDLATALENATNGHLEGTDNLEGLELMLARAEAFSARLRNMFAAKTKAKQGHTGKPKDAAAAAADQAGPSQASGSD